GRDPGTAISVLAVSRTSGTPVAVADAAPRSGQLVAVMGAPDAVAGSGYGASRATTATTVVRVAKMRVTLDHVVLHDAVQLDRAMPDDAVGGLVVDGQGHLVAIALGRGANGSGTAIPATDALAAARALRSDGRVQRAWLGVLASDLDPAVATMLELPGGARVTEMTPASPAGTAGIEVGDIIEKLGDQPIEDASDLVLALRSLHPGDRVTLSVQRNGDDVDMTVVLGG
ncbi:MAG: S1C family serine protease, partial [Acidimicrobiales bacterium]